jgi:hypothetical protein
MDQNLRAHVVEVMRYLEEMDEAGENFAAEILKYDADKFPVSEIKALQRLADQQNAYRRQAIRTLKKILKLALQTIKNGNHSEQIAGLVSRATAAIRAMNRNPQEPPK